MFKECVSEKLTKVQNTNDKINRLYKNAQLSGGTHPALSH
jgi:hypothetical protein